MARLTLHGAGAFCVQRSQLNLCQKDNTEMHLTLPEADDDADKILFCTMTYPE